MHPKNKIDKLYIAKVKGFLNREEVVKLSKGVLIDNKKTAPAKVRVRKYDKKTDTSIVELIIHEGKNHQVKNMFMAVNHEVLKLKRERISFLDLGNMKSGDYRYLNTKEVKKLYNEVTK
jgi:23S rRNA pseudouridine2605 synthase